MDSQLMREAAAREAARIALLREAAFREARAAEAASALASAHPLDLRSSYWGAGGLGAGGLGAGGLTCYDYASLGRLGLYGCSALPLHLRLPSAGADVSGALPLSASVRAAGAYPHMSVAALHAEAATSREQAFRTLAHEEAMLAATREHQARQAQANPAATRDQELRSVAHEEAILAAARAHQARHGKANSATTREHGLRSIAHEEAVLAATREHQARQAKAATANQDHALRSIAHEEAILAATREHQARQAKAPAANKDDALRSIAHEEAILAATREHQARRAKATAANQDDALRSIAHEEAILAATREHQARQANPAASRDYALRAIAHEEAILAATREHQVRQAKQPGANQEHALQSIAHEEAVLAATREQARRNLAHEEAIMAASREHAIRNLAHEEAILAATREQARRNLAHEEALLAATREQARRNLLAQNAGNITAATAVSVNPHIVRSGWGVEAMPLAATREYSRREIVHDCVEEEALYECKKLRSGQFTNEEEAYGDVLIELFEKGQVDIERGVSLRAFLAKALHCAPMRVTKKIAGKGDARRNYLGRKYLPVLDPDFQHYNEMFQTARENFLKVLNQEWENDSAAEQAASDDDHGRCKSNDKIKDKMWNKRVRQLADFYREYGIANLPIQKKYRELRDFVNKVRIQYRKKQLSDDRIAEMDELGFIWSFRRFVPWAQRIQELKDFRQRHGHSRVPFRYKENPSFGLWAANMRARYARYVKGKDSTVAPIAPEQIEALNALGFAWELSSNSPGGGRGPNYTLLPQVEPTSRQEMINRAEAQTQFFMGRAPTKAVKLNSSYWDELYAKVEANLRALDRLYKQEEAALLFGAQTGANEAAHPAHSSRSISSNSSSSSSSKEDEDDNEDDGDDNDASTEDENGEGDADSQFDDAEEDADEEGNDNDSSDEEASMGEWKLADVDDDECRQVEANLRALDKWYKEEAALEAAGKLKDSSDDDEFFSADEGKKKKNPSKAGGDDSSHDGEWL